MGSIRTRRMRGLSGQRTRTGASRRKGPRGKRLAGGFMAPLQRDAGEQKLIYVGSGPNGATGSRRSTTAWHEISRSTPPNRSRGCIKAFSLEISLGCISTGLKRPAVFSASCPSEPPVAHWSRRTGVRFPTYSSRRRLQEHPRPCQVRKRR